MSVCVADIYLVFPVSSGESRHSSSFTVSSHPQTDAQGGSRPGQNVSTELMFVVIVLPSPLCMLREVLFFLHFKNFKMFVSAAVLQGWAGYQTSILFLVPTKMCQ